SGCRAGRRGHRPRPGGDAGRARPLPGHCNRRLRQLPHPARRRHRELPGMELAGGREFDDAEFGHIVGPNITPDRETGIGAWSAAQIVTALRTGRRPDGTLIAPPMPIEFYRGLGDRDAEAIAAYVKSLKPVHHAVARSHYRVPLPPSYGPEVAHVAEPDRGDKVAYGAY